MTTDRLSPTGAETDHGIDQSATQPNSAKLGDTGIVAFARRLIAEFLDNDVLAILDTTKHLDR